jgi:alpha-methylacyl-CoA racemase
MEGFRPGVAERLGIGPDECADRNPRIIYGRMTGFGQDGPLAQAVGHDINYIALSGLLSMVGRYGQPPTPPLALAGDFGGGGMILALGILAALFERGRSGKGQVIDAAMVHGAALLGTCFYGYRQTGEWNRERGTNIVDSGAPYYDAYETADGEWLAVGAMEARFYADLVDLLELPDDLPDQNDQRAWPRMKEIFAEAVKRRTLDEWLQLAEGRSACIAPVLDAVEAPKHPHHVARGTFIEVDGLVQPAPAPRFSRTPATVDRRPPVPGEHTTGALADWGLDAGQVARWVVSGAAADRANGP